MEISRNLYDVIIIGGGPAGGAGAGAGENGDAGHGQGFLSGEIKAQLAALFPKFQNPVIVEAELDESPLSGELAGFVGELDGLTDKLICRVRELDAKEREERAARGELSPSLRLYRSDGSGGNILFHGVPGGHEFTPSLSRSTTWRDRDSRWTKKSGAGLRG